MKIEIHLSMDAAHDNGRASEQERNDIIEENWKKKKTKSTRTHAGTHSYFSRVKTARQSLNLLQTS